MTAAHNRTERFAGFLYGHRRVLFGIWLVHAFLLHYFVLGYMTGDGLAYRVTPVIELLQHGAMGNWKYPTDWSLRGHIPFVELVHIPFLALLGLRGLIVGFPLVLFPLCVIAVFRFIRELTNDNHAATFGAFAYVAMPMINAQAFAGLVDFVVVAGLAYWLYALLRLRSDDDSRRRAYLRIALATLLLTASRQQGVYVATALFPFVVYAMFGRREHWKLRIDNRGLAARAGLAVIAGAIPAITLQVYRACVYGSPLAPSELKILGIKLADGVPLESYLMANGIGGDDAASLAKGFFEGWIWKVEWPMGAFYHSQWLGAGFITILALATLPVCWSALTRTERCLLAGLVVVSLIARDFALPRWAYTLTIALTIVVGRSMSTLVRMPRGRVLFWCGSAILIAQLFRPEFDLAQVNAGHWISPRVNVAASPWFVRGPGRLSTYPDRHYKLAIIERTRTGYTTHLFGRRLTNEVVGTVRAREVGEGCLGLRDIVERVPDVLFVDELDVTQKCNRTCVLGRSPRCRLFEIRPERSINGS